MGIEKRKIILLCRNFLNPDSLDHLTIGGVQTYIENLLPVISLCGFEPVVIQLADGDFCKTYKGVNILGVEKTANGEKNDSNLLKKFFATAGDNDILLYTQDSIFQEATHFYSIAIQHGISWDVGDERKHNRLKFYKTLSDRDRLVKWYVKLGKALNALVCVDYNFINWFRAESRYNDIPYFCIPNFTKVPGSRFSKPKNRINIIFARRFTPYRGSRLFVQAIRDILEKYRNVFVTLAGEGPDEGWMRRELRGYDHVEFIKYDTSDSLTIHTDKNIAIIPTKGSEGTSLSLLEAMASNCAVIATDIGGLTNVVIDGYNGLLVKPLVDDIVVALEKLIENEELREELSRNAYETVKQGFSESRWVEKWANIFSAIPK